MQGEGWDAKNRSVSLLFGRAISIFMKHINCIQIYFYCHKNGGESFSLVFFFSFFRKTCSANVWHCLPESHLKCSFFDCQLQPALPWAQGLLASSSPCPANAFSAVGQWGWMCRYNGSTPPHKKSCLRRCHLFPGCWFLLFINRLTTSCTPSFWSDLS